MPGAGDVRMDCAGPRTAQIVRDTIDMSDEHFCPSCGVQYIHHHGLIGTCSELQKAKLKIEKLEGVLADYRNEQLKFNEREVEKIGKI